MRALAEFLPAGAGNRVVPPSGFTARLTVFTAAAMAFLAVFALALSLAAGRLADRWDAELARSVTIRISAPQGQVAVQTEAALKVLETTPGVVSARALSDAEERALLTPWFGPDLPLDTLPIPRLLDVAVDDAAFDPEGLRLRLRAEVPGAVLDDHTRWREPLVRAAGWLRFLGVLSMALIACATASMIVLAANSALAANAQVIRVLRLVGARDVFIARAFVRQFTLRAFFGALGGTIVAMAGVAMLPKISTASSFLGGLGFSGLGWAWPLAVPPLAAAVAYASTRLAAFRVLRGMT